MEKNSIIDSIRNVYSKYCMKRYLKDAVRTEQKYLLQYNGAIGTLSDTSKLENRIRICVHGIEKGFSHRNVRPAFGVDKIACLLDLLRIYVGLEGFNKRFCEDCLSTIKYYLDQFSSNDKISDIKITYQRIVSIVDAKIEARNATINISKADVDKILSGIDYEEFIASRHSCRFFTKVPVDQTLLEKAFKIAEHTPTACNRQAQKVYVFRGDQKQKLLNISPSRSFVEEIDTALLVTVDMRAYFSDEAWQCYVDGGLYAMNLLNAIHSTGLGCIPLTASVYAVSKRKELCDTFNIPLNEAPIICIGVGNREDNYQVNASYRRPFSDYVSYIK